MLQKVTVTSAHRQRNTAQRPTRKCGCDRLFLCALLLCCVEKATAIDSGKAGTVRGRARGAEESGHGGAKWMVASLMMMNKGGKKGGKEVARKGQMWQGQQARSDGGCGLYAPSPMPSVHWPPEPGFFEGGKSGRLDPSVRHHAGDSPRTVDEVPSGVATHRLCFWRAQSKST